MNGRRPLNSRIQHRPKVVLWRTLVPHRRLWTWRIAGWIEVVRRGTRWTNTGMPVQSLHLVSRRHLPMHRSIAVNISIRRMRSLAWVWILQRRMGGRLGICWVCWRINSSLTCVIPLGRRWWLILAPWFATAAHLTSCTREKTVRKGGVGWNEIASWTAKFGDFPEVTTGAYCDAKAPLCIARHWN